MVTVLAIDVGSSSVKAAVLAGVTPVSGLVRVPFPTRYDGVRAEVDAADIMCAVGKAAREAVGGTTSGSVGRPVDVVALSAMSPSWLAMDTAGNAITPVVTHQDRRSIEEARRIEAAFGRDRHLDITGNRPVPGGISSTTAAWFVRHQKSTMRRVDLVGHLQTLLLRRLTGARAADPSNASFTGLYQTLDADPTAADSGWDDELCALAGVKRKWLPAVLQADVVAGDCTPAGARLLGIRSGTPVLTGLVDTSAAVLLAGALPGMMINVSGSTDVLAVVTEDPRPSDQYLTRQLGVAGKWLSVATIPAAGSALAWAKSVLFPDLPDPKFFALIAKLAKPPASAPTRRGSSLRGSKRPASASGPAPVTFEPALAGSRLTVEQPTGSWTGLRLSTTREQMLLAVIDSLATTSAARLTALRHASSHALRRDVLRTGGTGKVLSQILYRDWNKQARNKPKSSRPYRFADVPEATLLGLGQLATGHPV